MAAHFDPSKTLSDNRQASFNYFLTDRFEAGIALTGTEVKAAKSGKVQLRDAYATVEKNEAWLMNAHISEYSHGNRSNHAPTRIRKLLLHRREIDRLQSEIKEKGLSVIPLRLYLKGGRIKCEIALAKGKKFTTNENPSAHGRRSRGPRRSSGKQITLVKGIVNWN